MTESNSIRKDSLLSPTKIRDDAYLNLNKSSS